jgi:AhpD family alkylhydroperoxidase
MSRTMETLFLPLTTANAPDSSKRILEEIKKSNGFIPILIAIFANSPTVLEGYRALDAVRGNGSFPPMGRQIILLAASVENHCNYCIAMHSMILKGDLRTPPEIVSAVRNNDLLPDAKLNALVTLVKELVRERGHAKRETIQNFLAAGYRKQQVMELLLGIALKTINNYLEHILPAPMDQPFAAETNS